MSKPFTQAFVAVILTASLPLSVACLVPALSQADDKPGQKLGPDAKALHAAQHRALDFLRTTQADDGSWTSPTAPGISGLVTYSLLRSGAKVDDPTVAKALNHLAGFVQKDGGIYYEKSDHRNYETSITLLAFAAANGDGRYTKLIAKARDFLKALQWDDTEGKKESDTEFGGAGYGKHKRPDLSNTTFLIEALKAAGVSNDDPAIKNAILFVSRCQNLETEHNTTPFASKVNDGGFYYTPAAGGNSQAGPTDNGVIPLINVRLFVLSLRFL